MASTNYRQLKNPRVKRMLSMINNYNEVLENNSEIGESSHNLPQEVSLACQNSKIQEHMSTNDLVHFASPERSVSPYITDYLNNNNDIKTPSTISNLSGLLSTVDFIASPTIIHIMNDIPSTSICKTIASEFRNDESDKNSDFGKESDTDIDDANKLTYLDLDNHILINSITNNTSLNDSNSTSILQTTILENIYETNQNIDKSICPETEAINDTLKSIVKYPEQENNVNFETLATAKEIETSEENTEVISKNVGEGIPEAEALGHISKSTVEHSEQENNLDSVILTAAEENESEQKNTEVIRKTLSRKRKRNINEWQDKKNKKLKNTGQSYTGIRSKKKYPSKSIREPCKCKKKCFEKFDEECRQNIFNSYWRLGDHESQWHFILRHVKADDIRKMQLERKNNRVQTITYFFPLNGAQTQVCKFFFLNTLSISERTVYIAIEKNKNYEDLEDKRGTHNNRPRKMSILTEESIVTHIKLFPVVESHYIRKQSKRLYLSENLNVSSMFRLYKDWFKNYKKDNPDATEASKRQYETIFNTKFNYSFFQPKKDRCATCVLYEEADVERKATLEENYRTHLKNKETIRGIKNSEKQHSDPMVTTVATFDLEKVLTIPQSNVGIFHYKRKYPVYNFTVFNILSLQGFCYVWHYTIAKRGAIEIGSCLLNFIEKEHMKGIQNISFYSDSCAGQNKNRYIFALYLYATKKYKINITHRFFEVGHSQSEGDAMHSCIERAKNKKIIYTPDQMYAIILNSKVEGKKYELKEMQQSDFYDIKALTDKKNWLRDCKGNKIMWSKIKEVSTFSADPDTLLFKYQYEAEFESLKVTSKPVRGRKPKKANDANVNAIKLTEDLKQAYNTPIPISKPLYNDLMSLCSSEAIPKYYHGFYRSLQCDESDQLHENDTEGEED